MQPMQLPRLAALFAASCLCLGSVHGAPRALVQDAPTPVGPNVAGPNAAALDSVWAAEREWLQAMRRSDVMALRSILSSDHIHVGTNGRLRHKTEMLLALQRGQLRFLTYDIGSYDIRITGTAAIVTGTYHTQLVRQGVRSVSTGRYIRVWVRDERGWRLMVHQIAETTLPRGKNAP